MKNRRNNDGTGWVLLGYLIAALIITALGAGYASCVGNSNLPDWVKFWLLS